MEIRRRRLWRRRQRSMENDAQIKDPGLSPYSLKDIVTRFTWIFSAAATGGGGGFPWDVEHHGIETVSKISK